MWCYVAFFSVFCNYSTVLMNKKKIRLFKCSRVQNKISIILETHAHTHTSSTNSLFFRKRAYYPQNSLKSWFVKNPGLHPPRGLPDSGPIFIHETPTVLVFTFSGSIPGLTFFLQAWPGSSRHTFRVGPVLTFFCLDFMVPRYLQGSKFSGPVPNQPV